MDPGSAQNFYLGGGYVMIINYSQRRLFLELDWETRVATVYTDQTDVENFEWKQFSFGANATITIEQNLSVSYQISYSYKQDLNPYDIFYCANTTPSGMPIT